MAIERMSFPMAVVFILIMVSIVFMIATILSTVIKPTERKYKVITIENCQYIQIGPTGFTHKGNCTNPIHSKTN